MGFFLINRSGQAPKLTFVCFCQTGRRAIGGGCELGLTNAPFMETEIRACISTALASASTRVGDEPNISLAMTLAPTAISYAFFQHLKAAKSMLPTSFFPPTTLPLFLLALLVGLFLGPGETPLSAELRRFLMKPFPPPPLSPPPPPTLPPATAPTGEVLQFCLAYGANPHRATEGVLPTEAAAATGSLQAGCRWMRMRWIRMGGKPRETRGPQRNRCIQMARGSLWFGPLKWQDSVVGGFKLQME